MRRHIALAFALLATPLAAEQRQAVTDRASFLSIVDGRALTHIGVNLIVSPDGRITGRAFGRPVTGEWTWQARYFCRSMQWGNEPLEYNCQTVDKFGNKLRFKSDRGTGEEANLRIK